MSIFALILALKMCNVFKKNSISALYKILFGKFSRNKEINLQKYPFAKAFES